jgi:hypothetical protein
VGKMMYAAYLNLLLVVIEKRWDLESAVNNIPAIRGRHGDYLMSLYSPGLRLSLKGKVLDISSHIRQIIAIRRREREPY